MSVHLWQVRIEFLCSFVGFTNSLHPQCGHSKVMVMLRLSMEARRVLFLSHINWTNQRVSHRVPVWKTFPLSAPAFEPGISD